MAFASRKRHWANQACCIETPTKWKPLLYEHRRARFILQSSASRVVTALLEATFLRLTRKRGRGRKALPEQLGSGCLRNGLHLYSDAHFINLDEKSEFNELQLPTLFCDRRSFISSGLVCYPCAPKIWQQIPKLIAKQSQSRRIE